MKTKGHSIRLRQFGDYRSFLSAYAKSAKAKNPQWSYSAWSKALGLKATSSLTKVLNAQREIGDEIVTRLVRYFKFNASDEAYFRDLVKLQKIKGGEHITAAMLDRMQKEHPETNKRVLTEEEFAVIAKWHAFTIREMVLLDDFVDDPHWISKMLRFEVSPAEVSSTIESLIKIGLLRRGKRGKLEIADGRYSTTDDTGSESLKQHHEQMLKNAALSIRTMTSDEREISASTLTIKQSHMPRAKELIREFSYRFAELMEEGQGDTVCRFQIQFFPLTRKIGSGE